MGKDNMFKLYHMKSNKECIKNNDYNQKKDPENGSGCFVENETCEP